MSGQPYALDDVLSPEAIAVLPQAGQGKRLKSKPSIDLMLEIIEMFRSSPDLALELGATPEEAEELVHARLSLDTLAEVCECSRMAIWLGEQSGLNKMRRMAQRRDL